MAAQPGTLELIARELGQALSALEQKATAESPENFIADLGLRLPPALVAEAQFVNAVIAVANAAAGLPTPIANLISALDNGSTDQIITAGEQLISAIAQHGMVQRFPTIRVELTGQWVFNAMVIAIVGSILGSLYPAFKAAQKDPIDALAYE